KEGDRNERSALGQLAKKVHTNRTYIWEARKLMATHPELVPPIRDGKLTIQQAKRLVGWDKPKTVPPGLRKLAEGLLSGVEQFAMLMSTSGERRTFFRALKLRMREIDLAAELWPEIDKAKQAARPED